MCQNSVNNTTSERRKVKQEKANLHRGIRPLWLTLRSQSQYSSHFIYFPVVLRFEVGSTKANAFLDVQNDQVALLQDQFF